MTTGIERKFLVADQSVIGRATRPPVAIRQAYLATGKTTLRVRIAGLRASLGVYGVRDGEPTGYEYDVPLRDAEAMAANLAVTDTVEKDRYSIDDAAAGATWTVDVFKGRNAPLMLAEIIQPSLTDAVRPTAWLGEDVSHDLKYQNVYLALHPYSTWGG